MDIQGDFPYDAMGETNTNNNNDRTSAPDEVVVSVVSDAARSREHSHVHHCESPPLRNDTSHHFASPGARVPSNATANGDAMMTTTTAAEPEDWNEDPPPAPAPVTMLRHKASMRSVRCSNRSVTNSESRAPLRSVRESPTMSSSSSHFNAAAPDKSKVTLHGKDVSKLVSIGSVEVLSQHSNSVDWSGGVLEPDETDHLSLMDPYYDLTKTKLTRLFAMFQPDAQGMVSYSGFRSGLEAMGIVCASDEEFDAFIQKVDEDHSGGISYEEFQHAVQEIKLAQLFCDDFVLEMAFNLKVDEPARIGTIDYSPDRIRSVYPIQNIEKFVYSKRPAWATVRWINVEGYDPLMVRRLSVRYRLHPLAVEDVLDVDRERPKYEQYDEHSLLVLQVVHAIDLSKLKVYQRMYRNSIYLKDEDGNSPIELMSKADVEDHLKHLKIGRVMTIPEQLSIYILKDVVISVQGNTNSLWDVIKGRLDTSYSKVRNNGSYFLVYSIVDACVDDLTPMAHAFGAKLLMLDRLMRLEPLDFDLKRLQHCSKQIMGLKRLCKPLNEAIVQLQESNDFTGEIQRYFRDVQDHLTIVEEECDKHLDTCRALVEHYHNVRANQQSQVSYTLTLVAAIFLPAQFLTGLYGMNFENMPELHAHAGYFVWWGVTIAIALTTIWFFHFYKRWI
ncbi:TPA: hypothetical protein N0F65_012842 [Lagenidium giganteum]|uniref:EF-hand domain-containing protein n=1 Tax=Lagenidium giganteum TaxID=4803 RepID=A0AAV2YL51_9STRA|nr:TPA: hypothetical protein N0F65_012842 [Lagenidium giganteum]